MQVSESDHYQSKIYELRKKRYNEGGKEATGWYASSLGTCMRKQVLRRLNVKPTNHPTMEAIGKMDMGNKIEDYHIQDLKDAGIHVVDKVDGEQIRVTLGAASGRLDALVDGYPYEIKSQQSRAFWHKKKSTLENAVSRAHMFQLLFYLIALKKERGTIMYISKDDQTLMELDVVLTPEDEIMITGRLEELDKAWEKKEIPRGKPDQEWECSSKWCPYYSLCKTMGFARVPFHKLEDSILKLEEIKNAKVSH